MRVIAIVSLGASAILGLGALVVAKAILPGSAAKARPAAEVGQPIVVAKQDIKYGQKLEANLLTVVRVPASAIPAGAFTTVQQALAQDRGGAPVTLTPIAAREPLLPAKLSGPGARPSVAAEIADGMRAYTIKVTDVTGVGGHALPGDRVDVVLTRDLTPSGDKRNFASSVVVQNVRVLGVDLNADLTSNKPASPTTATLEVAMPDAQRLSVAASLGDLSMALRRTGEATVTPTSGDILAGQAPVVRAASVVRTASNAPRGPSMIVVEAAGSGSKSTHRRAAGTTAAAAPAPEPAAPAPASRATAPA